MPIVIYLLLDCTIRDGRMKVLVTGAAGMLGSSLLPVLENEDHDVLATDINHTGERISFLDVRDLDALVGAAESFSPNMIVHLAAETDLEKCESDPDYAYEENFIGTQNACIVCQQLGLPLVYISTAGVFDGTKQTAYTEFDAPNPINVYGMSKFQGEEAVRHLIQRHFIVRAGWMIGGGDRDKKFVRKILDQLESGTTEIYAVSDKLGTPTYAKSFAVILEKLMKTNMYGTYHLTCNGKATRYDVAAEILTILQRDDVKLHEVTSDYFSSTYFAPRPRSEEMRNYLLDLRSMNDMPHWRDALSEYLHESFPDSFG
jgi:dTDP-4-dehydrorhamnose reductase